MSDEFDAMLESSGVFFASLFEDSDQQLAAAILHSARLLALAIRDHGGREPQEATPGPCDGLDPKVAGRTVLSMRFGLRPRKAMRRLGIETIRDLLGHTAEDLLECKNFGITGLNAVREKLAGLGLYLRGEVPNEVRSD